MTRFAVLLVMLLLSVPVLARDVDGIRIPDTQSLAGTKKPLVLNGAGYRIRYFKRIYVGALYAVEPLPSVDLIMNATTPRIMRLQAVEKISAKDLTAMLNDGFVSNNSAFDMQALRTRLGQISLLLRDLQPGDSLRFDMLPNGTTTLLINDKGRGSVYGADFQRALLKVWLGPRPADTDLKRALLGGKA